VANELCPYNGPLLKAKVDLDSQPLIFKFSAFVKIHNKFSIL